MANENRLFATADNTADYTSDVERFASRGYRTGVLQADIGSGDEVLLQGRVASTMQWIDILDIHTSSTLTEVVLAPEMRVVVTNHSGGAVVVMITE